MYSVVGCSECHALWVVADRPDTSQCPRCETRHQFQKLKAFVTTDEKAEATQARSAMLASRQGHQEAFESLDSFTEMEADIENVGIDDETYLQSSGVDTDAVADAAERSARSGRSGSQREIVMEALRTLESPETEAVVAYATERGVPADSVRDALDTLSQRGAVTERNGEYRVL